MYVTNSYKLIIIEKIRLNKLINDSINQYNYYTLNKVHKSYKRHES